MAFSTAGQFGVNAGMGAGAGYLGGGWGGALQGAGQAAVGTALGQIPVVGGMAQGAFGGAMGGGAPQAPQLNPAMTRGLTRAGMRPDDAPDTKRGGLLGNTRTAKIARGVGAGALSLIPGVGPVAGAGLMAAGQLANSAVDKRNAQAVGRNVGRFGERMTSMANRAKMNQAAQGRGRLAQLGGGAAGGGQRIKAGLGQGGMAGGPGGMTVAGVTGGPGGNATFGGNPLTRSQTRAMYGGNTRRRERGNRDVASASSTQPGTEPYGTAEGYRRSMRNARGKKGLARQSDEILAQQMRQGLDPGILSGLNQGAIQAAQGTRQTMSDALARTGDSSGYEAALRGGMDMALQNQLAQIYPEWLQKRQDYINDLVFKWRGTRRGAVSPTPSPSGGTDWGSILQGVGALGNTAANIYSTMRPQNTTNVVNNPYGGGNVGLPGAGSAS